MNPLATVIVFANSKKDDGLEETIRSVLQQTYKKFILYVCCYGSTARAFEAIEPCRYAIPLISINSHTENSALSSAIEATNTEYFGWLDSGDILLPTALEQSVKAIHAHPEVGTVYTNQFASADSSSESNISSSVTPYSNEKLLTDFIVTQFRLIRRSAYEKVGGINNQLPYCKAYDLILKISEVSNFLHVDQPLYSYRKKKRHMSHEEQIEKILWAREVASQALQRRGMASDYKLAVELLPNCYLIDKISLDTKDRQ